LKLFLKIVDRTKRRVMTENIPAGVPAAPEMKICPVCGHANRLGVLICINCGASLVAGVKSPGLTTRGFQEIDPLETAVGMNNPPETNPQQTNKLDTSPRSTSEVKTALDVTALMADLVQAGGSEFTPGMLVRIEVTDGQLPLIVRPKAETVLGRRDAATGTNPDVDFTAYSGYRMGVSRRHAILNLRNNQLEIQDLGSSNGTSVNGVRLEARRPRALRDGDEIILGKLKMRFIFQHAPAGTNRPESP
jgi:hypothetical protein